MNQIFQKLSSYLHLRWKENCSKHFKEIPPQKSWSVLAEQKYLMGSTVDNILHWLGLPSHSYKRITATRWEEIPSIKSILIVAPLLTVNTLVQCICWPLLMFNFNQKGASIFVSFHLSCRGEDGKCMQWWLFMRGEGIYVISNIFGLIWMEGPFHQHQRVT